MMKLFKILPHMLIVLALIFIAVEVLDWYNPYMNFLGLTVSNILIIAFCLLSLAQSFRMIFCEQKLSNFLHKNKKVKKQHSRSKKIPPKNHDPLEATPRNSI